jgi:hypothetical protein
VHSPHETVGVVPHRGAQLVWKQGCIVYASTLALDLLAVDPDGRGSLSAVTG